MPSQIQAQLTWNGTAQSTVTFNTTGHSSGDVYNLPLQVGSAVSTTGVYPWSVDVWATVGTMVYHSAVSGDLPVLVATDSPFGAGWGLDGTQQVAIGSANVIFPKFGGFRSFSGTPGTLPFTYTNPANDQGTMVKNADGTYTYTDKFQNKTNFNSSGQITSQVDPHGLTTTYAYSSGLLSTITKPDTGVATFSYSGGLVSSIAMPAGRYLTMTYDGSNNLTGDHRRGRGHLHLEL